MTERRVRRLKGRSYSETRSAVLDLIRSSGTITRVDLSGRSALTEATISKIVRDLLDDGVIVEAGLAESTGGKRPRLLTLNTGGMYAVGVALGETQIVVLLCNLGGTVLERIELPGMFGQEPGEVLDLIAEGIHGILAARDLDYSSLIGIGVATGGRRVGPRGWGESAARPVVWERYPTTRELSRRCEGVPVELENDANCAALARFWAGGRDAGRDFAVVYMSHGIGAGIVIGGDAYRGSGNAGEIGHTIAEPGGDLCWCGADGCLETVGPPLGLVRQVRNDPALARTLEIAPEDPHDAVYQKFVEGVQREDPRALALLKRSTDAIARTLLGFVNTLDLDELTLAGPGFAAFGPRIAERVQSLLDRTSISRGVHPIKVELGGVTADTAARGAASVVLHGTLTPHNVAHRGA